MKISYALPLAVLLIVPALLNASDNSKAAGKTITLDVPDGDRVDVLIPAGWSVDWIQSKPSQPPSIMLRPLGGAANLQITIYPDKFGNLASQAQVDSAVQKAGQRFAAGSLERTVQIEALKSATGPGAIAEFTDRRYAARAPAPGKYRIVGTGLVHLGKSSASFTVMGNAAADPAYVAAKNVLIRGISVHKESDVAASKTIRW